MPSSPITIVQPNPDGSLPIPAPPAPSAFDQAQAQFEQQTEALQQRLTEVLRRHGLDFELAWTVGGLPFLTTPGTLVAAVQTAIRAETGIETQLSTTGGTSDGRFIAQICPQVIELGPPNATIHMIDEHVVVSDIEPLKNIYRRVLEQLHAGLPA